MSSQQSLKPVNHNNWNRLNTMWSLFTPQQQKDKTSWSLLGVLLQTGISCKSNVGVSAVGPKLKKHNSKEVY